MDIIDHDDSFGSGMACSKADSNSIEFGSKSYPCDRHLDRSNFERSIPEFGSINYRTGYRSQGNSCCRPR